MTPFDRGLVLDASVGVKLVEEGHAVARALLGRMLAVDLPVALPDLSAVEVANALWTKARRRQLTPALAREGLTLFLRAMARSTWVPVRALAPAALAIALEHGVTVYDGCYLALARRTGLPLVSADAKLATPTLRRAFDIVPLRELRVIA